MDHATIDRIETWMPQFQNARGLIIDVRGYGGGDPGIWRRLLDFLGDEDQPPRVINVYRRYCEFREDHFARRDLYRES